MTAPDPIFAALTVAQAASAAHIAACWKLDESDVAAVRRCNLACDDDAAASKALADVLPATPAGLIALVEHYADDGAGADISSTYLDRLLAVLKHPDSERLFAGSEPQIASPGRAFSSVIPQAGFQVLGTMPGPSDIEVAWHSLPVETRDRIGIIAVDMVFQGFVYGDVYVVNGRPEDRAVSDEATRGAAAEAEDRRLNELHSVVENALPDLFGPEGENPAWCENPGPRL